MHPKVPLQPRIALFLYVSPEWGHDWGGHLGLWSGGEHGPDTPVKNICPMFNRAVLFDTSENSWHGLSREVSCPATYTRNSLAMYYLARPKEGCGVGSKARFALLPEQAGDRDVIMAIKNR